MSFSRGRAGRGRRHRVELAKCAAVSPAEHLHRVNTQMACDPPLMRIDAALIDFLASLLRTDVTPGDAPRMRLQSATSSRFVRAPAPADAEATLYVVDLVVESGTAPR